MNGKVFSGIMLTMLLASMLTLAFNVQPVRASGTIYIRPDGSVEGTDKIQRDGDTYTLTDNIYDTYGIVVEKDNIVLDGAGHTIQGTRIYPSKGIDLTGRRNVTIKNTEIKSFWSGIYLFYSSDNCISGNNITNNGDGIVLHWSEDNCISGNNITNNGRGVYLYHGPWLYPHASYNSISGNNITNNGDGIVLHWSSDNSISGNNITANNGFGISLSWPSDYNSISGNNITNNRWGVYLYQSTGNIFKDNRMANNTYNFYVDGRNPLAFINDVDTSNTVDGKPIYYWINKGDATVPPAAGYVALVYCMHVTVQNLNLTNNGQGVLLAFTRNSTITKNNITNNALGIDVRFSSSNTISGNNIINNQWAGVYLYHGPWLYIYASYNSISENNITSNGCGVYPYHDPWPPYIYASYNSISENNIANNRFGIWFDTSSNCSVSGNNIINNRDGIYLSYSYYNRFYHNNFIDNTQQVYICWVATNFWDDGYPSGGNYWSDHIIVDDYSGVYQDKPRSDGIVDEPYMIDEENRDNYPLVKPWVPRPWIQKDLEELVETIKSWNLPEGTENSLTSKLEETIHLLNKGNENGAIHKLMDFINQVEALRDKGKMEDWQADYLITEAQRIIDLI